MPTAIPASQKIKPSSEEQLSPVRALRGLAAFMVVTYHVVIMTHFDGSPRPYVDYLRDWFTTYGSMGVETFFILSGFVIAFGVFNKPKPVQPLPFLIKRAVRIYPPYALYTLFAIALYLLSRMHFRGNEVDIAYLIKSLLLVPTFNAEGRFYPVLLVGWTLYFQFYFYLLFAVALQLRLNLTRTIVFLLVIFALGSALGALVGRGTAVLYLISSPNLWYFLSGLILFAIYRKEYFSGTNYRLWLLASAVICLCLFVMREQWQIPAALLVFFTANLLVATAISPLLQTPRWSTLLSPLATLGCASFSLYLYHWLAISVISGLWKRGIFAPPAAFDELAIIGLVLVLALLSLPLYHRVERPITNPALYRLPRREAPLPEALERVNR